MKNKVINTHFVYMFYETLCTKPNCIKIYKAKDLSILMGN